VQNVIWHWLRNRRETRAAVLAAVDELLSAHGERARSIAVEFARASRDGRQFEEGHDAHFWWQVALEIDRRADRPRLDTATRYISEP
jgi:hypothetical protein